MRRSSSCINKSSSASASASALSMILMMVSVMDLAVVVVEGFQNHPAGTAALHYGGNMIHPTTTMSKPLFLDLEKATRTRSSTSNRMRLWTTKNSNEDNVNGVPLVEGESVVSDEDDDATNGQYHEPPQPKSSYDIRRFRCASYLLVQAAGIGVLSGWSVGIFKIFTGMVQHIAYAGTSNIQTKALRLIWLPIIPAIGGIVVSLLRKLGGGFPPGMRDTIKSVDKLSAAPQKTTSDEDDGGKQKSIFHHFRFVKKSMAATVTLGTGCSLGPEGPSVEIGMNLSRLLLDVFPIRTNTKGSKSEQRHQRRLLLACGAAAGVSAGFNAPLAGAFFALEIMQQAFNSIDEQEEEETSSDAATTNTGGENTNKSPAMTTASGNISAVLLASVTSALVCQSLLGEHLMFALKDYTMKTPLLELPIYLLLGATSGLAAFLFSQASTWSRSLFEGKLGPQRIRNRFTNMPAMAKPALGGLFCGLVGLVFPQILFSGYDTINIVLANRMLPTMLLLALFGVKMTTTAVAAGSGLVGGTFAPSLFLGGMVGSAFHNIVSWLLENAASHGTITLASPMLQMADLPAYAMVGSATLLAAVFRAPLTASLLLFELTRDYAAILPLMASSGVASVVGDILDVKRDTRKSNKQSRAAVVSK